MNIAESNLFRIQISSIREASKELNEIEIDKTKEKLHLIKNNIAVCERLLGEDL